MDKFQVYDRNNSTWEDDKIKLMSGWSENFVLDKTTDTASIKVKYLDSQKPNWKSGDWCRILHLKDGETGATYIKKTQTITESAYIYDDLKITWDAVNKKFIFTVTNDYDENESVTINALMLSNGVKKSYTFTQSINTTQSKSFEYQVSSTYSDFVSGSLSYQVGQNCSPLSKEFTKTIDCYIPQNHEQYIIKDITMVYDKVNEEWDCQLKLGEPIDITNGISCETKSFTNQIEKTVDNIEYTHEALNHYSVLKSILKTTPLGKENTWDSRIKIADIEWLKSQSFNDDTFSEPTLYDILINKFDSTLGRTPVLYFDIDGETDKPFNTQKSAYVLDFLRQDGFDKGTISYSSLSQNAGQIISNESWQNKADGLITNFSNLAPKQEIQFMSYYLWLVPEVETDARSIDEYVENSDKVWVLRTPHPIKEVTSITKLSQHRQTTLPSGNQVYSRETIDFKNILEEKEYKASDLYDSRDVIWYTEGENLIHLNDFYYSANDLSVYRVFYKPIISGRYDNGEDYQIIVNQVDGQVAEQRYSKYLEDYINSLNKTDLIIQKTIENWDDIYEIGSRVIDGDKIYIITNVSIQNRGFDYDVVYQLNENHLRKSDSIVAPQDIRKNIEIGYSGLTDRKSCKIINYELSQKHGVNNNIDIIDNYIDRETLFSSLLKSFNSSITKICPQMAKISFVSILDNNGKKREYRSDRLCAISKSAINNTFCFNMRYKDNAECGKRKNLEEVDFNLGSDAIFLGSPNEQIPILYTDYFGEAKYMDISLISTSVSMLPDFSGGTEAEQELAVKTSERVIKQTTNYPLTTGIEKDDIDYISTFNNILYNKDMLDIFNFTLGFKINIDENMILCNSFFQKSAMFLLQYPISYLTVYNTNMKEEDILSFPEEYRNITDSQIIDNQIVMTFDGGKISGQSIVVWNSEKEPILIINDIDKVDENFLTDTNIKINC